MSTPRACVPPVCPDACRLCLNGGDITRRSPLTPPPTVDRSIHTDHERAPPLAPHNQPPHNSVYAEYTIKDANTVAVHNYANEGSVNGIIHDVNLCAYVADPKNNPGSLAVAPCMIPRFVREEAAGKQKTTRRAAGYAHAHHPSTLHKWTHHLANHALHESSPALTGYCTVRFGVLTCLIACCLLPYAPRSDPPHSIAQSTAH